MVLASRWQWKRYLAKVELITTYTSDSANQPIELPLPDPKSEVENNDSPDPELEAVLNRKVRTYGKWDYDHQVIIANKKGKDTSPGHHLFTPLILPDGRALLVSRGFIPFESRERETWRQYDELPAGEVVGILKRSITPYSIGPSNPRTGRDKPFVPLFYFEEMSKLADQLPYPILSGVFVQRLGGPAIKGQRYPEESISIEVPPSTHFGYTIEWAILATLTLLGGAVYQLWPRELRDKDECENVGKSEP